LATNFSNFISKNKTDFDKHKGHKKAKIINHNSRKRSTSQALSIDSSGNIWYGKVSGAFPGALFFVFVYFLNY